MMRSKIWLNVLIMRLAIVVLMQIYFQGCLSNLDMQTNLSVEIQRLFQEYQEIIMYAYMNYKFPEKIFSEERSEVYWAGWALAEYQWATCRRFKDIFSRIPLSEIVTMYSVYHEMDIGHFIEDMNKKYMSITQEIHLKTIRENRGISQVELAALSGVKLRSIQMYEQKVNDIDKAQARTLYKLSRVLGCSIEDLLENPEL